MDLKLIVVTHKHYDMPKDDIYIPVCVGSGLQTLRETYQPDDAGDNISEKNGTYCELTAAYWAHKNLSADYLGLCHYRRYFKMPGSDHPLTRAEAESLLSTPSVILPPKRRYPYTTMEKHYIAATKGFRDIHQNDFAALRRAVSEVQPAYLQSLDRTLRGNHAHMLNMSIMPAEWFHQYYEWLFPVIDRTVELCRSRPDQRRFAGALSEFLIDVWLNVTGYPTQEVALYETETQSFFIRAVNALKHKLISS